MSRATERAETPGRKMPAGEFYVVVSEWSTFYVSPETARRVGSVLDRRWPARWVKFADLAGSRVWLRTRDVHAVYESTEGQRARDREFHRARSEEQRGRQGWEDD